ncbi:MAG TPA: CapA family protein [Candidatus Saccharimonadales bacterium]|nr:CapA family protein [Candidatus Saccharimonadales bacterium]
MKKLLVLIVIILSAAGLTSYRLYKDRQAVMPVSSIQKTKVPEPVKPKPPSVIKGKYLVSGDVFWGRGIDYYSQRSPLKYDWAFSRLNEFHPKRYDGWISDMECPVNNRTVSYQTQVDKLILQCPTSYLPTAAKWFTAMTIANNHTDNTGRQGFIETQQNMTKAGIQVFGDYDLSQTDNLCEVITLPAKIDGQAADLPIAMCGYHWLARSPTKAEIAKITEYSKYFPVWVFPHGGTEYDTDFTPQQQALYHQFIDAGASVVFGDHPHVVEPTEAYHGKLIVYSLGNLIYDAWFDNEVTKSLIIDVNISATVDSNLQGYLDMAKSCKAFKDDCLSKAKSERLTAPNFSYDYSFLAGDSSNANDHSRRKHLASSAVRTWMLKRTNWTNTVKGLEQN